MLFLKDFLETLSENINLKNQHSFNVTVRSSFHNLQEITQSIALKIAKTQKSFGYFECNAIELINNVNA